MKLLAIGRPRPGVDVRSELPRHAEAELRRLWEMYLDGRVREMYSPGGPGVVLVLEAPDTEAATAALTTLPLVAHEIVEFELIELQPFTALQVLFSGSRPSATVTSGSRQDDGHHNLASRGALAPASTEEGN